MFPHLTPGDGVAALALGPVEVTKVSVDPGWDNNAYLLRDVATGAQLLIDAAADPDRLFEVIAPDGDPDAALTAVVTTHRHGDHIGALAAVTQATGARALAGAADAKAVTAATGVAVEPLSAGDLVRFGDSVIRVIELRGHTPGSIALLLEADGAPHVFTGDSLFPGGVGNTGGDRRRFHSLLHDVTERLFDTLPDETVVHPGHGDDTTLGVERPHLREWAERGW